MIAQRILVFSQELFLLNSSLTNQSSFRLECRKAKTKLVSLGQIIASSKPLHIADSKRGKTCSCKSQLVLFLVLIR